MIKTKFCRQKHKLVPIFQYQEGGKCPPPQMTSLVGLWQQVSCYCNKVCFPARNISDISGDSRNTQRKYPN